MKTSLFSSFFYFLFVISSVFGQQGVPVKWQYPISVAGTGETIYVADRQLPGIWSVQAGRAKVFYKASKKFGEELNAIRCLAVDHDGQLLAGDSATRDIYRFDIQGVPQPLTGGKIGMPMGMAIAEDGTIYVSDLEQKRIVKVAAAGGVPETIASVDAPTGLALDAKGDLLVVCRATDPVRKVTVAGDVSVVVSGRPFGFAQDIAVNSSGTILVTDGYGKAIWNVAEGVPPKKIISGDPLIHPVGIFSDGDQLLVADPRAKMVFRVVDGQLQAILTE